MNAPRHQISLGLDPTTYERLHRESRESGVALSTLTRCYLKKALETIQIIKVKSRETS